MFKVKLYICIPHSTEVLLRTIFSFNIYHSQERTTESFKTFDLFEALVEGLYLLKFTIGEPLREEKFRGSWYIYLQYKRSIKSVLLIEILQMVQVPYTRAWSTD